MTEEQQISFYRHIAREIAELRVRILNFPVGEVGPSEWARRQGPMIDGRLPAVELQRLLFHARNAALGAAGLLEKEVAS